MLAWIAVKVPRSGHRSLILVADVLQFQVRNARHLLRLVMRGSSSRELLSCSLTLVSPQDGMSSEGAVRACRWTETGGEVSGLKETCSETRDISRVSEVDAESIKICSSF